MSISDFYYHIKQKNKNDELNNLYKKPVSENRLQTPITQVFKKGIYYQADLLYMPEDKGYKYILVCVDVYDGVLDCEPLKNRASSDIVKAFTKIFKRKYLKEPLIITFDLGSEFRAETEKYFSKLGIRVNYVPTGRHRGVAVVERANQKIASILFKRMTNQELLLGIQDKQWVDDLPELVHVLNEHTKAPLTKELTPDPIVDEYTGNLLKEGQKVRILLDYPIDAVENKRLHGKFRSTDIRWSPDIYKITHVLLKPSYPPMYLTSNNDNIARTKNQIQVVKDNEKEPDKKFLKNHDPNETGVIQEILDKKIENRKTYYLVRYKGDTIANSIWIPVSDLNRNKVLKQMKRDFDNGIYD
jgi:hypothetical protein